jgi:hypothetical protein
MRTLIILALLLAFPAVDALGAGWGRFRRSRRTCYGSQCYTAPAYDQTSYGTDLNAVAAYRAGDLARRGYGGHFWAIGGGFSAEGWGYGSTPQAALNSCCVFNSPVVGYATAQAANGGYFAIKLYR